MFEAKKLSENCFLLSILGCVCIHVYKNLNAARFANGECVTLAELKCSVMIDNPLLYINTNIYQAIGVKNLPEEIFKRDYAFPSVNEVNVFSKCEHVENLLQMHDINISFNLYCEANAKVHAKVISEEKTNTVQRQTATVAITCQSEMGKARCHRDTYPLYMTYEGGKGTKKKHQQFHVCICLNIGKFIFTN